MPDKTAIQPVVPATPKPAPDFGEADPQELEDGKRFDDPVGPVPDFGEADPQELEDGKRYDDPVVPAPDFGEADPQELEDGLDLGGAGPDGNDGPDLPEGFDFGEADPQELEDGKRFDDPVVPAPDFGEADPQELEDGLDLGGAGPDGNDGIDFGEADPQELEDGQRFDDPPVPAPDFGEADPQELEDGKRFDDPEGPAPDFGEADPQELEDGLDLGGAGPDGNDGPDLPEGFDFGEADPQELEDGQRFDEPQDPAPDFGEADPQELEDGLDLGGAGPDGNDGIDFGEADPQELEDGQRFDDPKDPAPDFGEADPQELEDGILAGGNGPDGNDDAAFDDDAWEFHFGNPNDGHASVGGGHDDGTGTSGLFGESSVTPDDFHPSTAPGPVKNVEFVGIAKGLITDAELAKWDIFNQ